MPLIKILSTPEDFKMHTDSGDFEQKSMKFGSDTVGDGESKQSKFLNKINDPPIPDKVPFIGRDYILRGGLKLPKLIFNDLRRFGNFLLSPEGILFVTKQNLLIRQQAKFPNSPPFELDKAIKPGRIWQPISTGLQIGGNAFGVHVLGKGLGPVNDIVKLIKKVGTNGDVESDTPTQDSTTRYLYQQKQWYNTLDTNRLGLLYQSKILGKSGMDIIEDSVEYVNKDDVEAWSIDYKDNNAILKFSGGPNAIIPGITDSRYKRSSYTNNWNTNLNTGCFADAQNQTFCVFTPNQIEEYSKDQAFSITEFNSKRWKIGATDSFGAYSGIYFFDFRQAIVEGVSPDLKPSLNKDSPAAKFLSYTNYREFNRTNWDEGNGYGLGNPGQRNLDRTNHTKGAPFPGFVSGSTTMYPGVDRINFSPVYSGPYPGLEQSDIVDFYITCIDNDDSPNKDVHLHFRSFIDSFSDSYSATWQGSKMLGRGEDFYTYGGFSRTISLGFKVHAQSLQEMRRMYSKLNYLASILAPDYSPNNGFMRGNLIKLSVGDYLNEQPGILTSLAFGIDDSTPWDIGRSKGEIGEGGQEWGVAGSTDSLVLPHMITVSGFNFIPIHSFLPKKVDTAWVDEQISQNINAPYINMGYARFGYDTLNADQTPVTNPGQNDL